MARRTAARSVSAEAIVPPVQSSSRNCSRGSRVAPSFVVSSSSPTTTPCATFKPTAKPDLAKLRLPGTPLDKASDAAVAAEGKHMGCRPCPFRPRRGADGARRAARGGCGRAARVGQPAPPVWPAMQQQARGLLLHAVRREGFVSRHTADALNLLNKTAVVQSYAVAGGRSSVPRELALARAKLAAGDADEDTSMGDWRARARRRARAPPPSRPWYRSKLVLLIVGITTLFVAAHVLLLARVLSRVHNFDAQILLLPFLGLSASAIVAAFAVGVNRLSDPRRREARLGSIRLLLTDISIISKPRALEVRRHAGKPATMAWTSACKDRAGARAVRRAAARDVPSAALAKAAFTSRRSSTTLQPAAGGAGAPLSASAPAAHTLVATVDAVEDGETEEVAQRVARRGGVIRAGVLEGELLLDEARRAPLRKVLVGGEAPRHEEAEGQHRQRERERLRRGPRLGVLDAEDRRLGKRREELELRHLQRLAARRSAVGPGCTESASEPCADGGSCKTAVIALIGLAVWLP